MSWLELTPATRGLGVLLAAGLIVLSACQPRATEMLETDKGMNTKESSTAVGAIRWDAWHSDKSPVGRAVERSLGPLHWHYRLPFFAEVISDTRVTIQGATQEVMDREIAYASAAGLDYWAFVTYAPESAMSLGLELYLSSQHRSDLGFCLLLQGGHIGAGGAKAWPAQVARYVEYFAEPTYQAVAGGRPLVYLFVANQMIGEGRFASWSAAAEAFDGLREATVAQGLPTPYLVVQDWSAVNAKLYANLLHFDAVSAYASNGGGRGAPYSELAEHTERWWDEFAGTSAKVIPLVSAGWDRRPRVENPVPWEGQRGSIEEFYETPTPHELASHLGHAVKWVAEHPDVAEAGAVLIYAWNENDEGGWIVPTLSEGTARLDAIEAVLESR